MTAIRTPFYIVLEPERGYSHPGGWGSGPVHKARVRRSTVNKPSLHRGQVAVKVTLVIDSAAFEEFTPSVEVAVPAGALVAAPEAIAEEEATA